MAELRQIVEIKDLKKSYPGVDALDGINLEIETGQIWGLLGPNGSGKSTLLKIMAGLLKPDRGSVQVLDSIPGRKTKAQVAYLPELDYLYKWMSVGEMLDLVSAMYSDWQPNREEELLRFMNLDRKNKIGNLSKGMRARLKLIITMSRSARLVLLDEPLSGIDPSSRGRIVDVILQEFRPEEQAMVISTHEVGEMESLFDSVIMLEQGKVKMIEKADDVRQNQGLSITELFREVYK